MKSQGHFGIKKMGNARSR